MNVSIGRSGFKLVAIASTWDSVAESYDSNEVRVEFEITKDPEAKIFQLFADEKERIEAELGYTITWYNVPEKISKRMFVKLSVNLTDEADWENQSAWLLKHLEDFHQVFGPRVRDF